MIDLMGNAPLILWCLILKMIYKIGDFVHRTFNGQDFSSFIRSLKTFTKSWTRNCFAKHQEPASIQKYLRIQKKFFEIPHQYRTQKHQIPWMALLPH
jgi:hypothetical protein